MKTRNRIKPDKENLPHPDTAVKESTRKKSEISGKSPCVGTQRERSIRFSLTGKDSPKQQVLTSSHAKDTKKGDVSLEVFDICDDNEDDNNNQGKLSKVNKSSKKKDRNSRVSFISNSNRVSSTSIDEQTFRATLVRKSYDIYSTPLHKDMAKQMNNSSCSLHKTTPLPPNNKDEASIFIPGVAVSVTPSQNNHIGLSATLAKTTNVGHSSATPAKTTNVGHSSATPAKTTNVGHSSATPAKTTNVGHSSATPAKITNVDHSSATPAKTINSAEQSQSSSQETSELSTDLNSTAESDERKRSLRPRRKHLSENNSLTVSREASLSPDVVKSKKVIKRSENTSNMKKTKKEDKQQRAKREHHRHRNLPHNEEVQRQLEVERRLIDDFEDVYNFELCIE